jgi:hypothetical protein
VLFWLPTLSNDYSSMAFSAQIDGQDAVACTQIRLTVPFECPL